MELANVLKGMEYSLIQGSMQIDITHLAEDSRKVQKGSLFFCRKGLKTDGRYYISEALKGGAAAIACEEISSRELDFLLEQETCVVVLPELKQGMCQAAARFYGYPQKKLTLIGVTGTKGKTTVSTMCARLLWAAKKSTALIGTNGIWIGKKEYKNSHTTPLLFEIYELLAEAVNSGCQSAVLEVSSLAVKQGRIDGLSFDLGIFTNFYPDHVGEGEHSSLEEYRYWKKQFLLRCNCCIVNLDDPWGMELKKELTCPVITYSLIRKEATDTMAENQIFLLTPDFWGSKYRLKGELNGSVQLSMPGRFNMSNSLAAASFWGWQKGAFDIFCTVMANMRVKGRCEIAAVYHGAYFIVDYAHNESSLEALLCMVREYNPERIVCVFGCGGERSRLRRFGMGKAAARLADFSVITQDNSRMESFESILQDILKGMKKEKGAYKVVKDRREAIRHCILTAKQGDFVLIIGKGHEEYQEIGKVRQAFSDVQTVKEIIKGLASDE